MSRVYLPEEFPWANFTLINIENDETTKQIHFNEQMLEKLEVSSSFVTKLSFQCSWFPEEK